METFFADFKELFGSEHYQLRSDQAIVRFWTLGCLAYLLLDEQRAQRDPDKTRGQIRQTLQTQHYHNLLAWVFQQYQQGSSLDQVRQRLAA